MKATEIIVFKVDCNDFDEAINNFLRSKGAKRTDFEIVAHHELNNGVSKSFVVGKYDWEIPDDDDKAEILSGRLHFRAGEILHWMHQEGLIKAGEYLIEINW